VARRGVGFLLLVVLLSSSCGSFPISADRDPRHPAPAIAWQLCRDGYQCGTLRVPLDYSMPSGRTISLALIRKPARQRSRRIGSLLLNPGGPGASGLDFLRNAAGFFANLNSRFDLVSWDTRGVGESTPVKCLSDAQLDAYFALDPVLDDPVEKSAYVMGTKDFVAGCQRNSGYLLPYMDTDNTARDLDRIRAALGDARLSYLGFSYGTYIGQWYAHLYPKHIRALLLDGVVDATAPGDTGIVRQVGGFDSNLQAFFKWCRDPSSKCTYADSGDPEAKLKAAMARLDQTPLTVGDRALTRSLAMAGVALTMYDESYWPYLDQAMTWLDRGNGGFLLGLADHLHERGDNGKYSNFLNGGNQATSCMDFYAPTDISAYDAIAPDLVKASPIFGPMVQYAALQCVFWPVRSRSVYEALTVRGAPPILLVGGTNDPATPYIGAQAVLKQIPNSVLLTRNGNGHTSYVTSACARAAEDAYLLDLTLPAPGTVCTS
jgi:pimeloyl-ACP methyl ester carboxylesterase